MMKQASFLGMLLPLVAVAYPGDDQFPDFDSVPLAYPSNIPCASDEIEYLSSCWNDEGCLQDNTGCADRIYVAVACCPSTGQGCAGSEPPESGAGKCH